MLHKFIVHKNEFLHTDVQGFYRTDYVGYQNPGNPDYLNVFKNTFCRYSHQQIGEAVSQLGHNLFEELEYIYSQLNLSANEKLYICVVPRSKALNTYHHDQLIFRNYFNYLLTPEPFKRKLPSKFGNGIEFITRIRNTKTTHLSRSNLENDGDMPYVGITKDTCTLSPDIQNKHILLIDDIYTKSINIDEDALQALLDCGAKSVTLFAIANTVLRKPRPEFDISKLILG